MVQLVGPGKPQQGLITNTMPNHPQFMLKVGSHKLGAKVT